MRNKILLRIGCAGLTAASALAGPLELSSVTKDSKWLLHLDFEAFRKTKIGDFVVNKILQPKLDDADDLKEMKLSLSLQNISSVTAYGPNFEKDGDGVLMIRTTADVKKDLDTLAGVSSVSGGNFLALSQLNPYPVYSFKSNVFIAPNIGNAVIVAKSKDQIDKARLTLLGKEETLAKSVAFADYPSAANTFFFL